MALKREVGVLGATIYLVGIIVGAGIYVIIGEAAGLAGNAIWVSFLLAAVIAAATGFSYAELASTFPYDSAEYLYTQRAFNDRRFAFGIGWLKIAAMSLGAAAVSLGFGGYLERITGWNPILSAVILICVVAGINMLGVKKAVLIDGLFVAVSLLGLVAIIIFGAGHLGDVNYLTANGGWPGIVAGCGLIFFAFIGFENIGSIGEEIREPKKNLPRVLMLSILVSTIIYILVAITAVSVIPWQELATSKAPMADVMNILMGAKGAWILTIMALTATGSTVLGIVLGGSRMVYGLAQEHSLPSIFKRTKNGIPLYALGGVAIIAMIIASWGSLSSVAEMTNFACLFIFMIINLCVITLRFSHHHIPRGFRIPFNIGKFPVIPLIGVISSGYLLFSYDKKIFLSVIVFLFAGIMLYTMFWERAWGAKDEKNISGNINNRTASIRLLKGKSPKRTNSRGRAAARNS